MQNRKAFWLLGTVAVIALLALFTSLYHSTVYKTEISEFDMKASAIGSVGIAPDSHFILNTTAPLSPQVVAKYVKVDPAFDFDVKEIAAHSSTEGAVANNIANTTDIASNTIKSFEIVPKQALQADKIYTIQIDKGPIASREFSWAYQVRAPFELISSLPANRGSDVPINTGIELTFNREDIINPSKYIEIFPEVSGTFKVTGSKIIFIPNAPLNEKTIYTIKIKSGLATKELDDTLATEKTIQFETAQNFTKNYQNIARASFTNKFNEYANGKDVAMAVYSNEVTKSVQATIYRFPTAQSYIDSVALMRGNKPWARYSSKNNIKMIEDKKLFTADIQLEKVDYSYQMHLPQELQVGHYAILISTESGSDVSWFEVNPAASFTAFSSNNSLIWLKDISSEKNISGTKLFLDGQQIAQTGNDGVALFKTPTMLINGEQNYPYYGATTDKFIIADIPSSPLVIPLENEYNTAVRVSEADKWWNYVSLNKSVFLPTDTIRFWTIIKPRNNEVNITNEEITVKLNNSYWSYNEDKAINYSETKVRISEYGTVTGDLSFSNMRPGTYDLSFLRGKELVARQTVTVNSYIKPAYRLLISSNKTSVFAGEPVTFKVKAEFFDGTPVSNLVVTHDTNGQVITGNSAYGNSEINLNSKGEGSFTITPEYTSRNSNDSYYDYWPKYVSIGVKPVNAEEGAISASTNILVFGPHIDTTVRSKQTRGNVEFTHKTNSVIIKDSGRAEPYWSNEDYKGPPVAGAVTNVEIAQIIYHRTQRGTGYDSINKLTYPIYDYSTETKPLGVQKIIADQDGVAKLNFKIDDKETYTFTFTTVDNMGRTVVDKSYVYSNYSSREYLYENNNDYNSGNYYLKNLDDDNTYKIGDAINMQIQNSVGDTPAAKSENFIFLTVNNGNIKYQISDTPQYHSTFVDQDIPNVGLWSSWFSKGRFRNTYVQNISFDANERRLNVDIKKDKQSYKPGDTINLTVKVTDKNGGPVKAEVNLSALDAAVFALMPDEKDPVNDLYRDIYSQLVVRTSNNPPYGGGGAEKGGGDSADSLPRSNLQEVALFKSIVTDSTGYANVQFKLPDNITSWRLTSQALTKDLFVGKDVSFIPVSLPFFLDSTLNSTYLAGDDLVLRLRTFGTAGVSSNINYSVESPTLPFGKISKVDTESADIDIGNLTEGNHSLTMRANSDQLSDALIRPLSVLDSYFTRKNSDFYEGVNGLKIKNSAVGYTTLRFSSFGGGQFYNELKSLSYSWGARVDQKGAEVIAKDILVNYFGDEAEENKPSISKYQSDNGGIRLLPYSSDELELSAISAHLFSDSTINRLTLKSYLNNALSDKKADSSRVVRALYGLTAFKDLVLTKIQKIKDDSALNLKDKIYVALALDSIGAKEEARSYYKSMIKPSVTEKSAYAYIDMDGDDGIVSTTLLAGLTASLEEPVAQKLAAFSRLNHPKETLDNFERLLYIKSSLAKLDPVIDSADVSFTYSLGDKKDSKSLSKGKSFELTLSPQQLASFELSDVKGKLAVSSVYEKKTPYQSVAKDNNISLSRNYGIGENSAGTTNNFNDGDMVRVWLWPKFGKYAIPGAYQVVDYLPSGLRAIENNSVYSDSYYSYGNARRLYPTSVDGQKVTFVIYNSNTLPMYYYARVVSKGTYKAEPAIMQSLTSLDSQTISNEDKVTIK